MQELLGQLRKAVDDYDMIDEGDRILVAVSGGKDSVMLLVLLAKLREFYPKKFDILGVTLDSHADGSSGDYSPIHELANRYNFEYRVVPTNIADVVFNIRKESSPCSLCARMRRGILHDIAVAEGCKKVALGHHADDAMHTLVMNLFYEGRIGCFSPKTYLSRKDLYVIRPLVYSPERNIINTVKKYSLPVVKSTCPVDKITSRARTRAYLDELERSLPGVKKRIYGALKKSRVGGW